VTSFLNKIGDRINPIVVKEMRQAVNSRFVSSMLVLLLTVELLTMSLMLLLQSPSSDPDIQNMRTGREVFKVLQGILIVSCILLIPTMTGGRLASERSDVKVDLLFISTLSPRAIMAGKFLAATALALLIFSACAPFMTFAYLLRGLEISTILLTLLIDFGAVLLGITFALLVASIPATLLLRVVLGIISIIVLGYLAVGAIGASILFLERGFFLNLNSGDVWLAFAGLAGLAIGLMGLMFVWSTAMISPATSNRVFPVKVYTFAFWVFLMLAFGIWSIKIERPEPMYVGGLFGVVLFSFHMMIACSERDEWGPRVQRRIPHSQLFRIPAFLLFSGSAGGFAFSVLGCAASIAVMYIFQNTYESRVREVDDEYARIAFLIAGYTYCYCMSAVLVRRLLYRTSYKSSVTWLVALILFGLGSFLPFIAHEAFFPRRHYYTYTTESSWLYLPSATVMIDDETRPSRSHIDMTITFLGVWAAGITAINLTWLLRQVGKFHPPRVTVADDEEDDEADDES
jgi:hypothetical protein